MNGACRDGSADKVNIEGGVKIRLSELLYLLFLGLMLVPKGLGFYDGQTFYKIFLVAAFLCIALKMCITEYTYVEWGLILFLLALSAAVYRVSGEKGLLVCMVTVTAMKNVSVKRAFRVGLVVWALTMGERFLTSLIFLGHVETAVQTKNLTGAVLRYFMGYPHPNSLHISYLALTAFAVYCVKETYGLRHLLVLMAGNLLVFFYSYSFTGAFTVTVYICLSYYVCKKKPGRAEYIAAELVFPLCVLFSVILPLILTGGAFELADRVFNNRIRFAKHFLTAENMTLLGNDLAAITTDIVTMDNSFVFALVVYGIPVFVLICAGYLMTIHACAKQKKAVELAMFCCFLAAGITEPFLFNTSFKNLPLLFIGERLFEVTRSVGTDPKAAALLKNRDIEITLPTERYDRITESVRRFWSMHRGVICAVSAAAALLSGAGAGIFCQYRPEVLELGRDNLLVYERIRMAVTAAALAFPAAAFISGWILKIADAGKNSGGQKEAGEKQDHGGRIE